MEMRPGYININKPYAVSEFSRRFNEVFPKDIRMYSNIIVLCIGTDRSTGDSLGPLVGHKLSYIQDDFIKVYGTLAAPVHAKNLKEIMDGVWKDYENPYIIGVDACLGRSESIGCIAVKDGPIEPGAGVNKKLPPVGHIHVKGIVNIGGFMEYLILQNTRLATVMRMAEVISIGICHSLLQLKIKEPQVFDFSKAKPMDPII